MSVNRNQKPKWQGPGLYYPPLPERWIYEEAEGQMSCKIDIRLPLSRNLIPCHHYYNVATTRNSKLTMRLGCFIII